MVNVMMLMNVKLIVKATIRFSTVNLLLPIKKPTFSRFFYIGVCLAIAIQDTYFSTLKTIGLTS